MTRRWRAKCHNSAAREEGVFVPGRGMNVKEGMGIGGEEGVGMGVEAAKEESKTAEDQGGESSVLPPTEDRRDDDEEGQKEARLCAQSRGTTPPLSS